MIECACALLVPMGNPSDYTTGCQLDNRVIDCVTERPDVGVHNHCL